MRNFIHFRDVKPNQPDTWKEKNLLSFDIDWVSDDVMRWFVDFLEASKIPCTVFITHDSPSIEWLRKLPFVELGIHPFFRNNIEDSTSVTNTVQELLKIVPEAKVLRSHRLTTAANWNGIFKECGIDHISNYVMFGCDNIRPFPHLNGIVEVPIFFADDGLLRIWEDKYDVFEGITGKLFQDFEGIRVFDFHPIHCFLNSESLQRYEQARDVFRNFNELKMKVNGQQGVFNLLKQIMHG